MKTPNEKPTPDYTPADGITQSILSAWRTCRYKSKLSLNGWTPKRRKKSFRFGSLVHDTLEFMYCGIRDGRKNDYSPKGISDFIWKKSDENLKDLLPSDRPEDIELEGSYAVSLLAEAYLQRWKKDYKRSWVSVEGEFDYAFHGYRLRGKRDAVFRQSRKSGGGLWLLETKTKSIINDEELGLLLPFDFQTLFYLISLKETFPKEKLKGCVYNVLRKPQLREGANEGREQFVKRIEKDIKKRPEHYFKRYEVTYPQSVVEWFETDLRNQLSEFTDWWNGWSSTYKNTSACVGRYRCEFLDHCSSGNFVGYEKGKSPFSELSPKQEEEKANARKKSRKKKIPRKR